MFRSLQRNWRLRRSAARYRKRWDVLNDLALGLRCRSYLEVGVRDGRCLRRVACDEKVGVDPSPRVGAIGCPICRMTSDAFFSRIDRRFDLVFIDGLHEAEQALRDIYHSIAALEPGGAVALHDCNPLDELAQRPELGEELVSRGERWNGDVWKSFVFVRKRHPELFSCVVERDEGIGVLLLPGGGDRPRLDAATLHEARDAFASWSWDDLQKHRNDWLGLVPDRSAFWERVRCWERDSIRGAPG